MSSPTGSMSGWSGGRRVGDRLDAGLSHRFGAGADHDRSDADDDRVDEAGSEEVVISPIDFSPRGTTIGAGGAQRGKWS